MKIDQYPSFEPVVGSAFSEIFLAWSRLELRAAAVTGEPDIVEKIETGYTANGKEWKVHLDGSARHAENLQLIPQNPQLMFIIRMSCKIWDNQVYWTY